MKTQNKVLFLCTGNSCRSQIAEAIVNDRLGDKWLAVSAGTHPSGYVHPKAILVLAEYDILHQGESKPAELFRDWEFDLVVTVCDSADEECPVWLGQGHRVHHSFPDPADAIGNDQEITAEFRRVRDSIAIEIPELLKEYTP